MKYLKAFLFLSPIVIVAVDAEVIRVDNTSAEKPLLADARSQQEFRKRKARFVHKTVIIPDDDKLHRGGEDAASTSEDMLVVADGVGGWARQGVDPGLYSRKLTQTIVEKFGALTPEEKARTDFDLKRLVHESNHIAAAEHLGSATCTVVRLKNAVTLETLNVGDSGYSIHRQVFPGDKDTERPTNSSQLEVVYVSASGQKGFNFPYQLGGRHGDEIYSAGACDGPREHTLQEKDIIVIVSDGVNDNMDPDDYHGCLRAYQWSAAHRRHGSPSPAWDERDLVSHSAAADCIARTAYFLGKDPRHDSPFARSAASYGRRYRGGKQDDITVTVAQVQVASAAAGVRDDASSMEGQPQFFPADRTDPHRNEPVFVYTESDAPIPSVDQLPTMDQMLEASSLYRVDTEAEVEGDSPPKYEQSEL